MTGVKLGGCGKNLLTTIARIKKILVTNKIPAGTSFKEDEIIINPIDVKA